MFLYLVNVRLCIFAYIRVRLRTFVYRSIFISAVIPYLKCIKPYLSVYISMFLYISLPFVYVSICWRTLT